MTGPAFVPSSSYEPMITLEQAVANWVRLGAAKHNLPLSHRLAKAFLGGLFLSFGGCLVHIIGNDPWFATNAPGLLKIIQGFFFPVGLLMIVLFQVDLVTLSQAIFILSTLKRRVPIWAFLVEWTIVFVGNLAGSLLFVGFVKGGKIYSQTPAYLDAAAHVADTKLGVGFGEILIRGIGCNMLVIISVFQASLMKDGVSKIVAAHFPIFTFVAIGFDHIIANMYLIPGGLMTGLSNYSTGTYIWKSMIASFIGNFIGAAIIVLPLLLIYGDSGSSEGEIEKEGASRRPSTFVGSLAGKGDPSPTASGVALGGNTDYTASHAA